MIAISTKKTEQLPGVSVGQHYATAFSDGFFVRCLSGYRPGLMRSAVSSVSMGYAVCLTVSLLLLAGCRSRQDVASPTIEFTKIPPAAQGGRERVDTISGRVSGARPGQRIVIYAMSGPWWVQPWPDQPFIPIQADSTWSATSHLGFKYAAMLVDPGYQPPPTMDVAPSAGGSVAALAIVDGVGKPQIAPTVPIKFSGYDWGVRTIASDRGGLNLPYEGDNAWVDPEGALHLRIRKKGNKWSCAEVEMTRSLGYGTYLFTVRDTSHLEPASVLSLNTFDDFGGEQNYREVDVEMSQWGDGSSKDNAQFGIQPFYVPGNVAPFVEPAGKLTHSFHWEPGRVKFVTVRGDSIHKGAPVVAEHVFTSGVPSPGHEKMQLLFYVVASDKYPMQKDSEVVLEKFEYLP
ncbi:LamG domain-containing protein [Tunturibacter empetritectus]|uniref:Uncharacterized protein n=2 Tax=Tunturiibacter empetritectus TaxID=3069691 RepID=A0A7W8IFY8_9BACT|nr:hypothetical protein [Edaphobacter lichenicola]MBB5316487.1 hypothetical protein [Edaphobacter lichenicola]